MQTTPIKSSVIHSVGYNGLRLRICFHNGGVFDYEGVPSKLHTEMLASKSPGAFFIGKIRGKFKHKPVK